MVYRQAPRNEYVDLNYETKIAEREVIFNKGSARRPKSEAAENTRGASAQNEFMKLLRGAAEHAEAPSGPTDTSSVMYPFRRSRSS